VKRRDFITLLGGTAAWPLAARAQPDGRVPLLGWLDAYDNSDTGFQSIRTALREALAKLGWIEGRNLKVEGRFGVTDANRLRAAAVELVSLAPDVIVAGGLCRRARCTSNADHPDCLYRGRRRGRHWFGEKHCPARRQYDWIQQ
jgi:hypothetical protein